MLELPPCSHCRVRFEKIFPGIFPSSVSRAFSLSPARYSTVQYCTVQLAGPSDTYGAVLKYLQATCCSLLYSYTVRYCTRTAVLQYEYEYGNVLREAGLDR